MLVYTKLLGNDKLCFHNKTNYKTASNFNMDSKRKKYASCFPRKVTFTKVITSSRSLSIEIKSPPQKKIYTRSTVITCSDFCPERQKLFPDVFFCNWCDNWDARDVLNSKLKHRYKCTAKHVSMNKPGKKKNLENWHNGLPNQESSPNEPFTNETPPSVPNLHAKNACKNMPCKLLNPSKCECSINKKI